MDGRENTSSHWWWEAPVLCKMGCSIENVKERRNLRQKHNESFANISKKGGTGKRRGRCSLEWAVPEKEMDIDLRWTQAALTQKP